MPYRNALRDNWNRFQQANDAEMRLAARQSMQNAVPQGRYGSMSMAEMFQALQGEVPEGYGQQDPMVQIAAPQAQQPQAPQAGEYVGYNTPMSANDVARRRARLAEAAGRGY